jgi:hypothetical protein
MRRVFSHSPVLHDLHTNADWYPPELSEMLRRSSTPPTSAGLTAGIPQRGGRAARCLGYVAARPPG